MGGGDAGLNINKYCQYKLLCKCSPFSTKILHSQRLKVVMNERMTFYYFIVIDHQSIIKYFILYRTKPYILRT